MNEKSIDSSADVALILILPIALLIIFLMTTWPVLLAGVVLYFSFNYWQRYRWQQWCKKVNPIFHQLLQENRGSITALDLAMKTNFTAAIAKQYLESKAQEFGAQYQDYEDQRRVYYFMTASTLGKILDDSEPPAQLQPNAGLMPLSEHQLLPPEDATATEMEEQATSSQLTDSFAVSLEPEPEHSQSVPALLQFKDGERLEEDAPPLQNQLPQPEDATPTSREEVIVTANAAETPSKQVEPSDHVQSTGQFLLQAELAKRLDVHSSTVYKRRDDPDFAQWSQSKDPEKIAWKFLPDTKQFCPLETQLE